MTTVREMSAIFNAQANTSPLADAPADDGGRRLVQVAVQPGMALL